MLPTTKIRYSYPYAKSKHLGLTRKEFDPIWKGIKKRGKEFEELYEQHIKGILEAIPKVSGFPWGEFSEETIFIYIVDMKGPCFSDPLTLKLLDNKKVMLLRLIHELCHNNMAFKFKDRVIQETIMDSVTLEVAKRIKLDASEEEISEFQRPYKELFGDKYEIIDLLDRNVKEVLGKF